MNTTHATYRFAPPSAALSGATDVVLYLYRTPAGGREVVLTRGRARDEAGAARECVKQARMLRRGGGLK